MMIELPDDAEARAESFPHLNAVTKKKLLATLANKSKEDQSRIIQQILRESGTECDFFMHVLGHETDSRVRNNKRLNPIFTK